MTDLRYPIGEYQPKSPLSADERRAAIEILAATSAKFRAALAGLTPQQVETPYRPDGWTVRQLAHHVPDSHMNGYIRCKLALTEHEPTIKPYDQDRWAELADVRVPIEVSVALLDAVHQRWVALLRGIAPKDFERRLNHPERGVISIDEVLNTYAWHGPHHVAHITQLRERMGWR